MQPPIPEEARRLISAHIPTVPHLEALVLARSDPARAWSASELADRLYIRSETAASILADLMQSGLLASASIDPMTARYATANATVDAAVSQLAEFYAHQVVEVTRLIHAHDVSAVQRLADAFRLGRRR